MNNDCSERMRAYVGARWWVSENVHLAKGPNGDDARQFIWVIKFN
jgi:hypothetical protein